MALIYVIFLGVWQGWICCISDLMQSMTFYFLQFVFCAFSMIIGIVKVFVGGNTFFSHSLCLPFNLWLVNIQSFQSWVLQLGLVSFKKYPIFVSFPGYTLGILETVKVRWEILEIVNWMHHLTWPFWELFCHWLEGIGSYFLFYSLSNIKAYSSPLVLLVFLSWLLFKSSFMPLSAVCRVSGCFCILLLLWMICEGNP